jgi:hypothetical protein
VSHQERLVAARQYDGLRQAHFARETGTLIVVVNAVEQGLDPADGECKWYTICDDHSQLVGHRTLELAKSHAANPLGWCEVCNGNDEADD